MLCFIPLLDKTTHIDETVKASAGGLFQIQMSNPVWEQDYFLIGNGQCPCFGSRPFLLFFHINMPLFSCWRWVLSCPVSYHHQTTIQTNLQWTPRSLPLPKPKPPTTPTTETGTGLKPSSMVKAGTPSPAPLLELNPTKFSFKQYCSPVIFFSHYFYSV